MFTKLGVIAMLVGAGYGVYCHEPPETYRQEVEIPEGSSLYAVAGKYVSNKDNINEVVYYALQESGIRDPGDIQPGQKFILTLKKV